MMSVSAHDRIAGRPSRARVLEEFSIYAQSHSGVIFMRKYEIARFALESPLTVREGIQLWNRDARPSCYRNGSATIDQERNKGPRRKKARAGSPLNLNEVAKVRWGGLSPDIG
jgi:hypothetical protein